MLSPEFACFYGCFIFVGFNFSNDREPSSKYEAVIISPPKKYYPFSLSRFPAIGARQLEDSIMDKAGDYSTRNLNEVEARPSSSNLDCVSLMEAFRPSARVGLTDSSTSLDLSENIYQSVFQSRTASGDTLVALTPLQTAERARDIARLDYQSIAENPLHPISVVAADRGANNNVFDETQYYQSLVRAHQALNMMMRSPAGASLLDRESDVKLKVVPDSSTQIEPGVNAFYSPRTNEITIRASALLSGSVGDTVALLAEEYLHPFVPGYGRREEIYTKYAAIQIARAAGANLPAPDIGEITRHTDANYDFAGIEVTNVRARIGELGITNIPDIP